MTNLGSLVKYFQQKLGNYDKQSCDQSVEQRILQDMDQSAPGEGRKESNFLIDVDLVRGSVFSKSKTRHRWIQVVFWGVLRTAFAPIYWDYWREHTTFRMAAYIMFHFLVQFLQAVCFLLIDPETSKSTQDDVFVPCVLAVFLGILHAHITASHGSMNGSGPKSRDKDPTVSAPSTVNRSASFSRSDSVIQDRSSSSMRPSDHEAETQAMTSAQFGDSRGLHRLQVDDAVSIPSTEPQASPIEWSGVRHRRAAHTQPGSVSSDADEEEAADELEDSCGPCGLPDSGVNDRSAMSGWSSRGVVRMRAATRSKTSVLRFKTTTHLQDDSGHTSAEEGGECTDTRFMEREARLEEERQQELKRDHSQSLDEHSSTANSRARSFERSQWWYSASATSLTSPTLGHEADGEDSEMELRRRRLDRFATAPNPPPLTVSQSYGSARPMPRMVGCESSVRNTVDPLSISVPNRSIRESYIHPEDTTTQMNDLHRDSVSSGVKPTVPESENDHLDDMNLESPRPVNTEALSIETVIPAFESVLRSSSSQYTRALPWSPGCTDLKDPTNSPSEPTSAPYLPLTTPTSTPITPVCTSEENAAVRRFRFRSWSIGLPVDSATVPAANTSPSLLPFCYGSSLGLSNTMLPWMSDMDQSRYCLWGLSTLGPMLHTARHLSSSTSKPLALGWDPNARREFSSTQALRTLVSTEAPNSGKQPRRRRDRSFGSDLSSAQSTSSAESQADQTNDRSGLHRDWESVHGIGAELRANPKSSWNGKPEELAPMKSDLLLLDPKTHLEPYKTACRLPDINQNSGGGYPGEAAVMPEALPITPEEKVIGTTVFCLRPNQSQQEEGDDEEEQLVNSVHSQSELHETSDPLYMACGVNEDTITARARQRANFLQLFLRRAHTYRHQTRAQAAAAHLSSDALDRYASRAHRINQLASTATAMPVPKTVLVPSYNGPAARLSESGPRKDEHTRLDLGSRRRVPSGLRNSTLAASQSASANFHGKVQFNFLSPGVMYNRSGYPQIDRKLSSGTRGQTASETEYDRINSDVGSDVDSSSGPEEVAIQEPNVPTQWTTVDRLASVKRDSTTEPRNRQLSSTADLMASHPTYSTKCPVSPLQTQSGGVSLTIPTGGNRIPHTGAYFRDASNASWSAGHEGTGLQSSPNEWLQSSEQKGPEDRTRPNRSRSNAVELGAGANGPGGREATAADVAFDDRPLQKPVTAETLVEKYAYPHQARDSSQNPWPQLSAGANDTIACYIWDGDKPAKCNLTMLDVGWNVIRAVERQGMSSDYILVACVSSIILPLLSVVYHWNRFQPSGVGRSGSLIANVTDTVVVASPLLSSAAPIFGQLSTLTNGSASNISDLTPWLGSHLADSLIAMHLQVLLRLGTKVFTLFGQPFRWVYLVFVQSNPGEQQPSVGVAAWHFLTGRWLRQWIMSPDLPGRLVILLGVVLRFNVYSTIFFLLCIAERTFQQRLLYAKYFFSLTSGRRARKYRVPQFRLNKLRHIKCWLTLRSYLKKRGPQRSVENIIVASFYVVFVFGLALGSQFISRKSERTFSQLINLDMMGLTLGIAVFQHRFLILGTKITKKYRNLSIILTEQINLYLSIEKKPYKKEDFLSTFQVLRLVEGLLKEVDGPFRICGWTVNPFVYNVFKLVLLSCFSTILSDAIGFKLKLHKLKLNAANW